MSKWLGCNVINMIITPMKSGQMLHYSVINGVAIQNLDWNWLIHTSNPTLNNHVEREVNININRQQLKDLMYNYPLSDDSYILLLDSDVVMQAGCVDAMINHLNNDPKLICSACRTKPQIPNVVNHHILTACALIKWKIYRTYIHLYENMSKCQCSRIASYGKVEYVPNIQLYEIDN